MDTNQDLEKRQLSPLIYLQASGGKGERWLSFDIDGYVCQCPLQFICMGLLQAEFSTDVCYTQMYMCFSENLQHGSHEEVCYFHAVHYANQVLVILNQFSYLLKTKTLATRSFPEDPFERIQMSIQENRTF